MLLSKNPTVKPLYTLPPFMRQRLTLQSALLSNPLQYFKAEHSKRHRRAEKDLLIKERASPKPYVVSDTTQTKDVMNAETNTKMAHCLSMESQRSKLKSKCTSALAKGAILASSPYVEIVRRLKLDSNFKQKTSDPNSLKPLPDVKRRRGILKKVVEDLTLEGMCSAGTTTDTKTQPTLDRILRENTLFLRYSKSCKTKKKRVRMDKKPALSYFSKKDPESAQSINEAPYQESKEILQASKDERPKQIDFADVDYSSDSSDASLERKPASLALSSSRTPVRQDSHKVLDELDAASDSSTASCVTNMSSRAYRETRESLTSASLSLEYVKVTENQAPQLNSDKPSGHALQRQAPQPNSDKPSRHALQRQVPQLNVCVKKSDESPKRPPCRKSKDRLYSGRVPRERLYFKNMFNLPGLLVSKR